MLRLTQLLLTLTFVIVRSVALPGQSATVAITTGEHHQVIDGFGAFQDGQLSREEWVTDLYFDDLGASIYRVDIVPQFASPYSDYNVYSPWFMGSATDSPFNLEDPDNPNGPEDNRARTYTGPEDYSRNFGGENAPIAVMGPDIDVNKAYFVYETNDLIATGKSGAEDPDDFKLIASMWSPAPWLKVSSGNSWGQNWWPGPAQGTPWPFVWGGNYAGGMLDVSGEDLAVFDDSELGGSGPTSALTQFARSLAAYLRGFQEFHKTRFYAISIQNELNFEQYYNSATYPLSSQYIAALKAARAELDKYDDLRTIRIMGPEDLLGNDAYGMWQYGGGEDVTHKNLQYLRNIAADSAASAAIDFFCIHGYGRDGVSAAGATSTSWQRWAYGWDDSPAPGIPDSVAGFTDYGKKSWMTETSGENRAWRFPATGFPAQGAWSLALRIHQALTTGRQSAWVYWTFIDADDAGNPTDFGLTTRSAGNRSEKYVAAKHYFRHIRPGAHRVTTHSTDSSLYTSAYVHEEDNTITVVLLNGTNADLSTSVNLTDAMTTEAGYLTYSSHEGNLWQETSASFSGGSAELTVPAYGIVTLTAPLATTAVGSPGIGGIEQLVGDPIPNPATHRLEIPVVLPSASDLRISLHDVAGRQMATLFSGRLAAGRHRIPVSVAGLPAGSYFCRLQTSGTVISKKFVKW